MLSDPRRDVECGQGWFGLAGNNLGVTEAQPAVTRAVFDGTPPPASPPPPDPNRSPDGRWLAVIRDHNLWLKPMAGGTPVALSTDGSSDDSYALPAAWSANGTHVITRQIRSGDSRTITLAESSPADQIQPKTRTVNYAKPGDRIQEPRPRLCHLQLPSRGHTG